MNHSAITITLVGGPTALIEIDGVRFLTDPTFDGPRSYVDGDGDVTVVSKLTGPAITPLQLPPIDVVLLSHDQHPDNLDDAGRGLLPAVPVVMTTPGGAARLGANTVGLEPWSRATLVGGIEIVAVPAQHGPGPHAELVSGEVTGFVIDAPGRPRVYVSGDNVDPHVAEKVMDRFGSIDVALLFGGGASVPFLFDGALVTMTNEQLADAAAVLSPAVIIPIHAEGWSHYTEDRRRLPSAFRDESVRSRLRVLTPGESVTIGG